MASFSHVSKDRLKGCDDRLKLILNELIKIMDVRVTCGYRNEEDQNEAFELGASKQEYPYSKHNSKPSMAVDVVPYPVDWEDINRFERMCGIIEGLAHSMNIKIRLGRDFSFNDYPHIEIID